MAPLCLAGPRPWRKFAIRCVMRILPGALRLLLLASALLRRDFRPGAARLGESDGDRLLAALDLAPGAAAAQRSLLALVHRTLHFALGFLPVAGHDGYSRLRS